MFVGQLRTKCASSDLVPDVEASDLEEDSLAPLKAKIAEYLEYEKALENAVQVILCTFYQCSCTNTAGQGLTK